MAQNAQKDGNHVSTLLGVSSTDGQTPVTVYADPITHRLLVTSSGGGGGGGAVNSVSNSDSTLTITPTTGTVVAILNTAHSNTWTAGATFTNGGELAVANLETMLFADQFTGSGNNDMGDKINTAYAALPSAGGCVAIPSGTFSFSTPIVFGTNGKFVSLRGTNSASTFLKFTPTSGTAMTVNDGNPIGHLTHELTGFTMMGSSSLIAGGQTNTNTSVGIFYGGGNGAVGVNTHDTSINGFGTNWQIGSNAYMLNFQNNSNSGGNGGQSTQGALVHINAASNSGERNVFQGCNFTDPGNSNANNAIRITAGGTASNFFSSCSFDDVQIFIGGSNGQTTIIGCHFENADFGDYGAYVPVLGVSSDRSTQITFIGNVIANDTSGAKSFDTIIHHGGQLYAASNNIQNYGGGTISQFINHDLDNGVATDYCVQLQVQGGALTNIIGGSGGVAYSLATGNAAVYNVANSYTIGLRANGSNTNEFFSGSTTVGSFDHSGNWIFTGNVGMGGTPTTPLTVFSSSSNVFKVNSGGGAVIGLGTDISAFSGDVLDLVQANTSDMIMTMQNFTSGKGTFLSMSATSDFVAITLIGTGSHWNFGQFGSTAFQVQDFINTTTPLSIDLATPSNTIVAKSSGNVGIGAASPSSLFSVGNTSQFQINTSGKVVAYSGIATTGWGTPSIYGTGRVTGQTAAAAAFAAYTVGGADGSFLVSANINVTAATTASFTTTCTYTDEGNTSRTLTMNFSNITGTLLTTITNITGTGAYEGVPLHIRAKASTAITFATVGTFTSVTYNAEASITQIA